MSLSEAQHAHDHDAEVYVLAAALAHPEQHEELVDGFRAGDFYSDAHRALFAAVFRTDERGWEALETPDVDAPPETIELAKRYVEAVPGRAAFGRNAERVKNLSRRRRVAASVGDAAHALSGGEGADAVIERLLSDAERALSEGSAGAARLSDAAQEVVERALLAKSSGGIVGIRTGYGRLDQKLGGLQPGRNYVVGARAGMGKSTFAAVAAMNAAREGHRVLVQSTEMTRADYLERAARAEAGITDDDWENGAFGQAQTFALHRAIEKSRGLEVYVDDRPGATPAEMRRNIVRTRPDLVFVDYLQRMEPSVRAKSEYEEVTAVSLEVDRLKNAYNVPLLTVVQLNRNADQRQDKRPLLSDLRSSGQIEQDANVVLLLHRPGLFDGETEENLLEVNCAKNRHGNQHWTEKLWKSAGVSHLTDDRRFIA